MDVAALFADLDDDQRRAVATDHRLVAVIAGAGSGKTRVLTRRIAHRVAVGSAAAEHTLALTFTREAAGELRRRLPRLGLERPVMAGTFHTISRQLLMQRWADTDQRPPTLRADRHRILADIIDGRDRQRASAIGAEVDIAAAHGWSADQYRRARTDGRHRAAVDTDAAVDAIERYRLAKRERNIIDLDDLIALTVSALERDDGFADRTRWRYRHLLVDEAQDLNPLQQRLIDLLRRGNDDLFLVGDPAQAIYGFNGSDPTLLVDVSTRFAGVEVIRLPTNHRSTPQVVDIGRHVLKVSGQPSALHADRDDGVLAELVEHGDDIDEARAVAADLAQLDPHLIRHSDVAVLARTHAVLSAVRAELDAAGVPVRSLAEGSSSPIAPYLRALYRLADSHQIRRWAQDRREQADDDGDEALATVVAAALDFLRERPTGSGADFEAWVQLTDPFGDETAGVEVLTFHAAKGREWHTVHLIGCETSLVPHRSATTKAARAEEARLLYVALTRATDRVVANWAERRGGYQRRITPLLDGFESSAAPAVASTMRHLEPLERDLVLERLRAWRADAARRADILPSQLVADHVLTLVADHRPATSSELAELTGIGTITAGRWFAQIADAMAGTSEITA